MLEKILIIDFGSPYTQLLGRRLRELNVYCEIYPFHTSVKPDESVKGVILSGSANSAHTPDAPSPVLQSVKGKLPLLAIGYGAEYLVTSCGGKAAVGINQEFQESPLIFIDDKSHLFRGIDLSSTMWAPTRERIVSLPDHFTPEASTGEITHAAYKIDGEKSWGVLFHPEVSNTSGGSLLLKNFLIHICGCTQNWTPDSFITSSVETLRQTLGGDQVVLGLSGGVDSSVSAMLLHKAIGRNLHSIFVDHGLLRKNEFENVLRLYKEMGLQVTGVNAREKFYRDLQGVTDPEEKRKIIGRNFIEVFDEEACRIENVKWLAQGTIYPDVIESVSVGSNSVTVKSHHNVGGLPEKMNLRIVEPLRYLFKNEVRQIGKALGLRDELLMRHPFPGPGLGIRILGEVTPEKVTMLQEADAIFMSGLKEWGLYDKVWQAGVILLPVKTVGVWGDKRTYAHCAALRTVTSTDAMTAEWTHLPYEFLDAMSRKIINDVRGINRVVFDISSKPPATIEWE